MEPNEQKIQDLRKRVDEEPDFINSKRYNFSLKKYKQHNEKEVPDNIIALLLCMTPKEVNQVYISAIEKARRFLKVEL